MDSQRRCIWVTSVLNFDIVAGDDEHDFGETAGCDISDSCPKAIVSLGRSKRLPSGITVFIIIITNIGQDLADQRAC